MDYAKALLHICDVSPDVSQWEAPARGQPDDQDFNGRTDTMAEAIRTSISKLKLDRKESVVFRFSVKPGGADLVAGQVIEYKVKFEVGFEESARSPFPVKNQLQTTARVGAMTRAGPANRNENDQHTRKTFPLARFAAGLSRAAISLRSEIGLPCMA
jgi:hypothetical protein